MRRIFLTSLLCFGFVVNVDANTLTNDAQGYSLDFPSGWTVVKGPTFSVEHQDGSSFEATQVNPPENIESVKVAALMGRATALAAGLCGGKASEFDLSASDWGGSGFHCNNRSVQGKSASETIGFTVKRGNAFHQFFLFIPRQDWDTNKEQYLSLFRSLRFLSS